MDQPVARRTRSHAGKHTSTEHNISSPLFKLPAEVRNNIYKFVLGGNVIHIVATQRYSDDHEIHSYKPTFSHFVCSSHLSETALFEMWKRTGPSVPVHRVCNENNCEKLSLQLLRTCRQIYDEAGLLPYSENVFSFRIFPSCYERFAMSRTKKQAHAIRSISVHIDTHRIGRSALMKSPARYLQAVKRFTGLKVVHIHVVAIFPQPEQLKDVCSTAWKQRYWANDVLAFGIHKLTHVTVIISPKHRDAALDYDPDYPIEKEQLLAWAETMMTDMLGPWDVMKNLVLLMTEVAKDTQRFLST